MEGVSCVWGAWGVCGMSVVVVCVDDYCYLFINFVIFLYIIFLFYCCFRCKCCCNLAFGLKCNVE